VSDTSPKAWEKVVDELLASKQYGERWGRHWLDLVRYAETNSFERDGDKPFVCGTATTSSTRSTATSRMTASLKSS
jgi:hypothetical protein